MISFRHHFWSDIDTSFVAGSNRFLLWRVKGRQWRGRRLFYRLGLLLPGRLLVALHEVIEVYFFFLLRLGSLGRWRSSLERIILLVIQVLVSCRRRRISPHGVQHLASPVVEVRFLFLLHLAKYHGKLKLVRGIVKTAHLRSGQLIGIAKPEIILDVDAEKSRRAVVQPVASSYPEEVFENDAHGSLQLARCVGIVVIHNPGIDGYSVFVQLPLVAHQGDGFA